MQTLTNRNQQKEALQLKQTTQPNLNTLSKPVQVRPPNGRSRSRVEVDPKNVIFSKPLKSRQTSAIHRPLVNNGVPDIVHLGINKLI